MYAYVSRSHSAANFTKVIIPAVYHEWKNGPPSWVSNDTLREELGYSIFLYTKQDRSSPNYIDTNRGCENGVSHRINLYILLQPIMCTYLMHSVFVSSSIGLLQVYR